jgi:D-alanyl-D-alanine dipeptidase
MVMKKINVAIREVEQEMDYLPKGFVYLSDIAPEILQDIRYATSNNFIGRPIDGYEKSIAILVEEAARNLKKVSVDLKKQGLALKVFDCYRPHRAVEHFISWGNDLTDMKMQQEYYPGYRSKKDIFNDGYISKRSQHSRGSAVDLTLVCLKDNLELDMGTPFDFFSDLSHTANSSISKNAAANRMILKDAMEKHGFENYHREWWHFGLKDEPFNEQFDFVIR